jgi:broad specificity phosphatase PhoE
MEPQKTIHVKIIRHSDRLDHSHKLYWLICIGQYWADSPLSPSGYENAKKKAIQLKNENFLPKIIYTSPYNRTLSTATEMKSVFPHANMVIEPLLAEVQQHYGHAITLYPKGIPTLYDGFETTFSYPETTDSFSRRVQFIISKLIEKSSENILIITHGEVIKSYIGYLQTLFPNVLLDSSKTPYLTVLSFDIDMETYTHIPNSIKIEIE